MAFREASLLDMADCFERAGMKKTFTFQNGLIWFMVFSGGDPTGTAFCAFGYGQGSGVAIVNGHTIGCAMMLLAAFIGVSHHAAPWRPK